MGSNHAWADRQDIRRLRANGTIIAGADVTLCGALELILRAAPIASSIIMPDSRFMQISCFHESEHKLEDSTFVGTFRYLPVGTTPHERDW